MDTPEREAQGKWYAEPVERMNKDDVHMRGGLYAVLGLNPEQREVSVAAVRGVRTAADLDRSGGLG
jgi:hypothetical protein